MIDISRRIKHKFSNPFNPEKLGYGMARVAFYNHMKHVKISEYDRRAAYICSDQECQGGNSFHMEILIKFLNKS
jgi:hypothetical protein